MTYAAMSAAPIALKERLWAPDVARGLALLGIALSNMYSLLHGIDESTLLGKPLGSTGTDLAVDVAVTALFDNRGFPLFSILFGYGIGMLHARSQRRGESASTFLLSMLKRHGLLLVIGLTHAVFLFSGDIISTYAVLGMIVCLIAVAPWWVGAALAGISVFPLLLMGVLDGMMAAGDIRAVLGGSAVMPDVASESLLNALGLRTVMVFNIVILCVFFGGAILLPMLIGLFLQRADFFSRARDNSKLYGGLAAAGIVILILGALPSAYLLVTGSDVSWPVAMLMGALHQASGLVGAFGYVSTAALIGAWRPKIVYPLVALGTMSMSGYLFQSLVWAVVYPAYGFNFGAVASPTAAFLVSLAMWGATLVIATIIHARGGRGPIEWVFRRILYGKKKPAATVSVAAG